MSVDQAVKGRNGRDPLFWILLLIVAAEAALFLVAARRGLDLTDEGYYLLAFRHWDEWPAASFFGAYFSLPFALSGHDVWAMRVLGFALLLGSGAWFGDEVNRAFGALANNASRDGLLAASAACGAAIWNYYGGFIVPYTPSYNLLTLLFALLSLALALRLGRAVMLEEKAHGAGLALALGVTCSAGIACKFSAGVLVLALALLIVCTLGWRRRAMAAWFRLALALALGLLLNVAVLWLADRDLPARFQSGIAVSLALLPRNPSAELAAFLTDELPREVLVCARILLWPLVFALLALVIGALIARRGPADAVAVALLVVGALLVTFVKDNRPHRIVLLTLLAISLSLAALWLTRGKASRAALLRGSVVAGAILLVPFAYSFGTNNPLLRHMGMAAIFPSVLAVAQVRALWGERAIPRWVFAAALVLLTGLPAEIVARQWADGDFTYRLGAPLSAQTVPIPRNAGEIDLRVSTSLARGLDDYLRLVRDSGFRAGEPMIDFTGQAPGLVAASGGVPLGALWIVGGPNFDGEQMARVSLRPVDRAQLRRAWLLTSRDSFASVASWQQIMDAELGAFAHEAAGSVTVPDPTSNDKTRTIEVTLWRPRR